MPGSPNIADHADALAQRGLIHEAFHALRTAGERNDPDALFELAAWHLSGRWVRRDLAAARTLFDRAGRAGSSEATDIHIAFLANGTGGAADWPQAMAHLAQRARVDHASADQIAILNAMTLDLDGNPTDTPQRHTVSETPHIEIIERAFTLDECRYLTRLAEPFLEPALTIDPRSGAPLRHVVRTSDAAAFPLAAENPVVHALNRRIAAIARRPVEHGEPLQVLRYQPGQQYHPHSDALPGESNQRVATVLVYLNEGYEEGETAFSELGWAFKGKTGDALLFHNVDCSGAVDPMAVHAGRPVTAGSKFVASRWIRASPLMLTRGTE